MRRNILKKSLFFLAASLMEIVSCSPTIIDIDVPFVNYIDTFYYFDGDNDGQVTVKPRDNGLSVIVQNSDNICDVLKTGSIVYTMDGKEETTTLVTWDSEFCDVITYNGQKLNWNNVLVYACDDSSASSSSTVIESSSTAISSASAVESSAVIGSSSTTISSASAVESSAVIGSSSTTISSTSAVEPSSVIGSLSTTISSASAVESSAVIGSSSTTISSASAVESSAVIGSSSTIISSASAVESSAVIGSSSTTISSTSAVEPSSVIGSLSTTISSASAVESSAVIGSLSKTISSASMVEPSAVIGSLSTTISSASAVESSAVIGSLSTTISSASAVRTSIIIEPSSTTISSASEVRTSIVIEPSSASIGYASAAGSSNGDFVSSLSSIYASSTLLSFSSIPVDAESYSIIDTASHTPNNFLSSSSVVYSSSVLPSLSVPTDVFKSSSDIAASITTTGSSSSTIISSESLSSNYDNFNTGSSFVSVSTALSPDPIITSYSLPSTSIIISTSSSSSYIDDSITSTVISSTTIPATASLSSLPHSNSAIDFKTGSDIAYTSGNTAGVSVPSSHATPISFFSVSNTNGNTITGVISGSETISTPDVSHTISMSTSRVQTFVLQTYITTIDNTITSYTTYCPLTTGSTHSSLYSNSNAATVRESIAVVGPAPIATSYVTRYVTENTNSGELVIARPITVKSVGTNSLSTSTYVTYTTVTITTEKQQITSETIDLGLTTVWETITSCAGVSRCVVTSSPLVSSITSPLSATTTNTVTSWETLYGNNIVTSVPYNVIHTAFVPVVSTSTTVSGIVTPTTIRTTPFATVATAIQGSATTIITSIIQQQSSNNNNNNNYILSTQGVSSVAGTNRSGTNSSNTYGNVVTTGGISIYEGKANNIIFSKVISLLVVGILNTFLII
ncbi:uncharacterized protein SCDLUD_003845 [Saccharomycodes ludwigii]|uniref:uncharacterized protein n=1 Tax=Saccharomycodes ludwigii TaxID=36035 RepID=UPI001E89D4AA|nr:hypothetical protein SCDLUD_003845 [Saccharomycodes ludwigii]KAH3899565.1 hypothetical protein SCDLUD_003845 [Saccharomycodes ludwigii]